MSTSNRDDNEKLLQAYLEHHLAGAAGGIAHIERMAELDADSNTGRTLKRLADQIAGERDRLRELADLVGADAEPAIKEGMAWVAEKFARLMTDPRVGSRSPLGRVLDLELMMSAVAGKRALWQVLSILSDVDPRLPKAEAERYFEQSTAQIATLLELHHTAARVAFTDLHVGKDQVAPA